MLPILLYIIFIIGSFSAEAMESPLLNSPVKQDLHTPPPTLPAFLKENSANGLPPQRQRSVAAQVEVAEHSDSEDIDEEGFRTPKKKLSGISTIKFTPNQTRSEEIQVQPASSHEQNITIDPQDMDCITKVAMQDAREEQSGMLWASKDPVVTEFINFDDRVLEKLAPMLREQIRQMRQQQPFLNTPEKSIIGHALTVEHALHIITNGVAWVCLPGNDDRGRINITARLDKINYSPAVTRPGLLLPEAWGTLTFMRDKRSREWKCIHYFNQPWHPQDTYFSRGGRLHFSYFLEAFPITVACDDGKLVLRYDNNAYNQCLIRLRALKNSDPDPKMQQNKTNIMPPPIPAFSTF